MIDNEQVLKEKDYIDELKKNPHIKIVIKDIVYPSKQFEGERQVKISAENRF